MQTKRKADTLVIKDGWVMCPVCGKMKVLRIEPDTTAHALPVYCRRCGQESVVNIEAPEPASTETSA